MYTSKLTDWTSVRYRFAKLNLLSLTDLIWVFKALHGINHRAQQIARLLTGLGNPSASWDANWNDPRADWRGEGGLACGCKGGWGSSEEMCMLPTSSLSSVASGWTSQLLLHLRSWWFFLQPHWSDSSYRWYSWSEDLMQSLFWFFPV